MKTVNSNDIWNRCLLETQLDKQLSFELPNC